MEREYLNKKDLQGYLKISSATVDRLMKEGLPHVKLRRRVLFRVDLIDRWLEDRMKQQQKRRRS
ncbi:MAG: helix-turn-helix domain-containing protein [Acidobacteriota bacterium]